MAPVALFLPIWAFMIWGTLEEPSSNEEELLLQEVRSILNAPPAMAPEVEVEWDTNSMKEKSLKRSQTLKAI